MNQDELLHLSDLNLAEFHREISRWNPNTDIAEQGDIRSVKHPPTRAKKQLTVKERSFVRIAEIPTASASSSFPRVARKVRPKERAFYN